MTRRLEGYVVGRQTVRQVRGWKIKRRGRFGDTQYFAPATEVASGYEIRGGIEVTFLLEVRDGREYACNVQPKTATTEDSMRRLRTGLIVAVLAITALGVAVLKPHHHEPLRGHWVELRAQWALQSIRELTADALVSDTAVRAAVRNGLNLRSASWAAREAVFAEHQCYIFEHVGYADVEKTCHTARYSEGRIENNVWYENAGIPVSIAPVIAEMRRAMYETGRQYLGNPDNLRALAAAKRDVIVDEMSTLETADQLLVLSELIAAQVTFASFLIRDDLRDQYEQYLQLEAAWRGDASTTTDAFRQWTEAKEDLAEQALNLDVYLFAGRRYKEGGEELVRAYLEIMRELSQSLTIK